MSPNMQDIFERGWNQTTIARNSSFIAIGNNFEDKFCGLKHKFLYLKNVSHMKNLQFYSQM